MSLREYRESIKMLWVKACEHDSIDPEAKFVVLSNDNPYWERYYEAIGGYIATVKLLKNSVPIY